MDSQNFKSTTAVKLGAYLLALAVILGAFGAHVLKGSLTPYGLVVYEKGIFYHFVHAIGILLVAILGSLGFFEEKITRLVIKLFAFGIFFFSGSLYALAVTDIRWLGAITPIGGVCFIVGWIILGLKVMYLKA